MSRAKLLLLGLVAALSVVALSAASSASARISFQWWVGGTLLQANQTQAFHVNSDGNVFDFHSILPAGAGKVLLLSSEVSVRNGVIRGGVPGTNLEILLFQNVITDNPPGCLVETLKTPVGDVETEPLTSEIVEGENGEVLLLFKPESGTVFVTLLFLQKVGAANCILAGKEAAVEGNILGLPLPQRTAVLRQNIVFPAVTNLYLLALGESSPLTAGLSLSSTPALLTGLTLILLTSDLPFGPF